MSIQVTYRSQTSIVKTPGGTFVYSGDNTFTINGMDTQATLSASTTPPVSKEAAFEVTLSSGTATIDLTSLPDDDGNAGAITLNALKIATLKIRNKTGNANSITVAKGASNGYVGLGSSFSHTLAGAGDEATFYVPSGAPSAVGSSNKTLDITGTGSQVLQITVTAG